MTQAAPLLTKIPTKTPQPDRSRAAPPPGGRRPDARQSSRAGPDAPPRGVGEVIELEYGINEYPAREEHGRWRAVWPEDGETAQPVP